MLIVFCNHCSTRIPDADFKSGAAAMLGENSAVCAACKASPARAAAARAQTQGPSHDDEDDEDAPAPAPAHARPPTPSNGSVPRARKPSGGHRLPSGGNALPATAHVTATSAPPRARSNTSRIVSPSGSAAAVGHVQRASSQKLMVIGGIAGVVIAVGIVAVFTRGKPAASAPAKTARTAPNTPVATPVVTPAPEATPKAPPAEPARPSLGMLQPLPEGTFKRPPPERPAVALARVSAAQFEGGQLFPNFSNMGHEGRAIWGVPTGKHTLTAALTVPAAPAASDENILVMKTLLHDRPEPSLISIQINGTEIFKGRDPQPNRSWMERSFPIPAGVLKEGSNQLSIQNLEDPSKMGQSPWFMVNWAEFRKKSPQ